MQPGRRKSHQSHAWRTLFRKQFNKTKLCHYYSMGQCRYGNECPFAHDESELTIAPDLTKTTMCKAWAAGQCQLPSEQCPYAHGQEELRVTPAFEVSTLCKRRNGQEIPDQEPQQGQGTVDEVPQGTAMHPMTSSLHGPQGSFSLQADACSRHARGTTDTRGTANGAGIHCANNPNPNGGQFCAMGLQARRPMNNNLTLPISRGAPQWAPETEVMFFNQRQDPVQDNFHASGEDKGRSRATKKRASQGDAQTAVVNLSTLLPKDAEQQASSNLAPPGFLPGAPMCQNYCLDMRVPFPAWPHAVMAGAAPPIVAAGPNGPWIPAVSNVDIAQMFGSQNRMSPGMPRMQPGASMTDREQACQACQTEPYKARDAHSPDATSGGPETETPISGLASTSSASRMDFMRTPCTSRMDWARTPSGAASPVSPKRWGRRPRSPTSPISPKRWGRTPASEACPDSPKLRWARTPSSAASPERGAYWTRTPSPNGSPPRSPRSRCEPAYVEPGGVVTFRDMPDDPYEDEPLSPVMHWTRTPSMSPPRRVGGSLRLTNRGPPEESELRHRLADIFPAARSQLGVASGGAGPWGALPEQ